MRQYVRVIIACCLLAAGCHLSTTAQNTVRIDDIVRFVNALLPSSEDAAAIALTTKSKYPLPSVREAIANSLIHQDLYITGAGPVVEIFDNRMEVTNPGTPLVDIMRIIDNPPKSRNEKLASLMRRMKMCEELGRGWDRMVLAFLKQLSDICVTFQYGLLFNLPVICQRERMAMWAVL